MIGVLIIPTGIGAEIGGHAGDANPVAKLIGACCDKLILHPNVVNASDINEMPENALYVEGSILDRFLEGRIRLREVLQNRILVVVNKPIQTDTINAVSAARATVGIKCEILELVHPLRMVATMKNGCATGEVSGVGELLSQVSRYDFDALAVHTKIECDRDVALNYYRHGGLNPWGGVEAKASRMIANRLGKPVAHSPLENVTIDDPELYHFSEIVDPRIAAEAISSCYLHCVLKGLNRAPVIGGVPGLGTSVSIQDVAFMISPWCWGRPHEACLKARIPIIVVRENKTVSPKTQSFFENERIGAITVENYWEAAGVIMSMRAGIAPASVRRPLQLAHVYELPSSGGDESALNRGNKDG